ncbi:MAG TPA: hypothetical protein VF077_09700 [Nitrospiraceae bacterium]
MAGSGKPGDALGDRARDTFNKNDKILDRAITKLEVRAEMRSAGEEELSGIIEERTLKEVQRKEASTRPPTGYSKDAIWFIRSVRGWPQAIVGLGLLAFLAFLAWLKWGH